MSRWLGYDASLLARLTLSDAYTVRWVARLWLISIGVVAGVAGAAGFLSERSVTIALGASLGVWFLLLNLVRLFLAGGGRAPSESSRDTEWRPSWTPVVFFAVLALIFAQPAQLVLAWHEFDDAVADHRAKLLRTQTEAAKLARNSMAHAGNDASVARLLARVESYPQRLDACPFLVFRLKQLWQKPYRVALFTGVFVALILLPSALMQTGALPALRAYEQLRDRRNAQVIGRANIDARAAVSRALRRVVEASVV